LILNRSLTKHSNGQKEKNNKMNIKNNKKKCSYYKFAYPLFIITNLYFKTKTITFLIENVRKTYEFVYYEFWSEIILVFKCEFSIAVRLNTTIFLTGHLNVNVFDIHIDKRGRYANFIRSGCLDQGHHQCILSRKVMAWYN
jgi:hypothetical protein